MVSRHGFCADALGRPRKAGAHGLWSQMAGPGLASPLPSCVTLGDHGRVTNSPCLCLLIFKLDNHRAPLRGVSGTEGDLCLPPGEGGGLLVPESPPQPRDVAADGSRRPRLPQPGPHSRVPLLREGVRLSGATEERVPGLRRHPCTPHFQVCLETGARVRWKTTSLRPAGSFSLGFLRTFNMQTSPANLQETFPNRDPTGPFSWVTPSRTPF